MPAEEPQHAHCTVHSSAGYSRPRVVPHAADMQAAAEVLNRGRRVAILVGAGALGATDEVVQVADILGAGVAKALLGKTAVPDDLPFVTGSIGLLGTKPTYDLMRACDTLLMIGSSFPYSEFLPREGQARGVQIDLDPRMIAIRYPMEVKLVGDSAETLRSLIPLLEPKADRSWRDDIETKVVDWWTLLEERAHVDADPINPQRVFWELSPRLPERCVLTGDSGTVANWFARDLMVRRGMLASLSGTLATMGSGVPYAIAAKFAHPDRVAIALVGDGAMQMSGLNELITVAKYWERWSDPRLVVLVLNNRDLNLVTWEQRALEGDPRFAASQDLPDFPYARYAELLGLEGIRVESPDDLGAAWDEVLSADRPAVLEAVTDPDVPPLPPHIGFEQAKNVALAVARGDSRRARFVEQSFKEKLRELVPGWR
jgi:pyruvate dehydrogenase (quinone)